ncbi:MULTISPECIES: hypothetical protein [unclassified Oceanispirochaeta]|uniref:hypothetical protein n=1 Tax=unclassified Oceanispirochaeta TaxID=2635722 RepID=UPI000E08D589|nr:MULTISPECIES: hypothetical protein [unclassified Oceanispirochaeta]MBF9019002.1 hypothetical protein [Oceanispirochaeta sp. M2]NPD75502.1 hypothetical protein [Oceanispirochaeta sp. M1]RDG28646.1 hypothetical protein DV872_25755 [Oceanispirochaeta sp. M1]
MDSFDSVSFLHEVANPSSTPRSIDYTGLESLAAGAVQNDTLILSGYTASGSPSLIRLNPSTDTVENIIPPGLIEVLSINPSPDGSLYVQGILLEDRTSCLMKIDSDGNRTILLDDLNSTIDDVVNLE